VCAGRPAESLRVELPRDTGRVLEGALRIDPFNDGCVRPRSTNLIHQS
jgi:hypothetical protein